jgi:hypothetical protein
VVRILRRLLLPARRDADVTKAKQSLDRRPFPHVVALDGMPGILQQVAKQECANSPVPWQEKEQKQTRDGQGNPKQVNREIERVLMPLTPIAQRFAQEV